MPPTGPRSQARFGLDRRRPRLLFGVVSRLTAQKGLDLLLAALPTPARATAASSALLGSGEPALEAGFRAAALRIPAGSAASSATTRRSSHLLQGGADAILVPSRFEPCGLTQLYGLRYGTSRSWRGSAGSPTP